MSVMGRWRIVEMPDYVEDYPDMMEPAYILFESGGSGEFVFGCIAGQIHCDGAYATFSWQGNDETDEARGNGWAELQPDGSLGGEICFHNGDEAAFNARRHTSSAAC
jgi:hypothetical protein